jgi:hypothetical protein
MELTKGMGTAELPGIIAAADREPFRTWRD